jgi:Kef-type K+ transport system membrane component KefB
MLNSVFELFNLEDLGAFSIVIGGSLIIILSYFANLLAKRTNIPSVLVLIAMGIGIRQGLEAMGIHTIPYEGLILELLGTVGLIFILLEAALDLELSREKLPLIFKSATISLLILIASTVGIAAFLEYVLEMQRFTALVYSIPLSIMSSAIIIPSVGGLSMEKKEFMVYESTFSDIWGIMAFYLLLGNQHAESTQEIAFAIGKNLGGTLLISIVVSYLLVYVLQKISSPVKLFLSIAVLMLIYSIQKLLHLSPLILILIFGLMLNNYKIFFPKIFKNSDGESWFGSLLNDEKMAGLRHDFHVLTLESAFVIRTFFFVMFGATVIISSLMNLDVLFYGLVISVILYVIRYLFLLIFRPSDPTSLLYIAPRGLITILLFFQIGSSHPELVSEKFDSAILLVVILVSCIVMTISLIQQGSGLEPIEAKEGLPLLASEGEQEEEQEEEQDLN